MEDKNTPIPARAQYYTLKISTSVLSQVPYILSSNSERALVIATLQDTLSARLSYNAEMKLNTKSLATHIDLLSFSITRDHIMLLVFSISEESLVKLGRILIERLTDFQNQEAVRFRNKVRLKSQIKRVAGPHVALDISCKLHSCHSDWEYDRYSSVGFYLHGRRGDWMRLWRLTRLYQNSEEHYYSLMQSALERKNTLLYA